MGSEIRVLVVDDEAAVRALVVRALGPRGCTVTEAADGGSALALVEEQEFDVVLLDQGLPDIPGTEVLRRLRGARTTATIPVLLVTGQGSVPQRVEGLAAGANDYLVKPVDLEELVARVEAQVRGRDAWRTEVADALSERAALAAALASIEDVDAADVATRVSDLLAQIPGVRRLAVLDLTRESPIVLADAGFDARPASVGRIVHPSAAAELRQAIITGTASLAPRVVREVLSGASASVVALGVEDHGDLVAALVMDVAHQEAVGRNSHTAPDAGVADLLPVVDRVLGPCLSARRALGATVSDIRAVLAEGAFTPVFQPIIDLGDGEVVGFEALTRFVDGTLPEVRFTQAARLGVGLELEIATLEAALRAAAKLPADRYLSFNVSATLLLSGELAGVLPGAGAEPLVLEITEHERIDDFDAVDRAVARLGEHVRLCVDDAGSGWASLRHVLSLRPHHVKLDRAWIHDLERDPARQALLLGIGRFVEQMGGLVIAEGIETELELAALRALGVHRGQGFLLGRPAPAEDHAHV